MSEPKPEYRISKSKEMQLLEFLDNRISEKVALRGGELPTICGAYEKLEQEVAELDVVRLKFIEIFSLRKT